ncbi:NB-ARC domain-containing protein [Nocardiopsis kunsanensis]|uniref:NB-ARC domain-containing protein n=1 Tax=Nocardiopsis kunsanensis TaxID=141693 RepID=UPI00034A28F2|nr:NB-ARC domain-containing protein [Nocardiopsis kunsanensis]
MSIFSTGRSGALIAQETARCLHEHGVEAAVTEADSGVGAPVRWPTRGLIVLCCGGPRPELEHALHDQAARGGARGLPVVLEHPLLRVGPIAEAGAPCSQCLERRRRQLARDGRVEDLWRAFHGAGGKPRGVLPHEFALAAALAVDDEGDLDRLAGAVRSALSERRVLLVIENVENEEQIRPLLPGYEGCAAIITGRSSLLGIAGSTRLRLRPLRPSAGVEYFTELWTGEPAREKAVRELVDYCDGLPLALRICALRGRERFTRVEDVLQELRSSTSPLSRLRAGDLDVRECLEWTLERCDIEQRLLLTQIAELDQDTFRFDDLLRAVPDGVNRVEAASALASLVEISALDRAEVDGGDGYRMRNLVRQYLLDGDRTGRDAESVAGT